MIRFICPRCKTTSQVDERKTGPLAVCPACGLRLQLPTPSEPLASPVLQADDGIPDEDETKLRAELPGAFFPGTEVLGRPRYRVERQVLDQNAYKPANVGGTRTKLADSRRRDAVPSFCANSPFAVPRSHSHVPLAASPFGAGFAQVTCDDEKTNRTHRASGNQNSLARILLCCCCNKCLPLRPR
jgi:hypothetical protein